MPAWFAVSVQVPALTSVRVVPLTVQTTGVADANVTWSPDDDVAMSTAGAVPSAWLPGDRKVIVCAPAATLKLTLTGVAAA